MVREQLDAHRPCHGRERGRRAQPARRHERRPAPPPGRPRGPPRGGPDRAAGLDHAAPARRSRPGWTALDEGMSGRLGTLGGSLDDRLPGWSPRSATGRTGATGRRALVERCARRRPSSATPGSWTRRWRPSPSSSSAAAPRSSSPRPRRGRPSAAPRAPRSSRPTARRPRTPSSWATTPTTDDDLDRGRRLTPSELVRRCRSSDFTAAGLWDAGRAPRVRTGRAEPGRRRSRPRRPGRRARPRRRPGCRCAAPARAGRRPPSSPTSTSSRTPAAACTACSLRARPAPSRQAATPTASASHRSSTPDRSARTSSTCCATGSGADGSPPCAAIIASQTGYAAPDASTAAGSASIPASASISRARATVSATTSAGPPPRSTSTDSATSSALPTARPSGTDMSVSTRGGAQAVRRADVDHRRGQLPRPLRRSS